MKIETTVTYDEVKVTANRSVMCDTCGKRRKMVRTFTRTVSPFGRNADGSVRTAAEVRALARADAEAWDPSVAEREHEACRQARTAPPAAPDVERDRAALRAEAGLLGLMGWVTSWIVARDLPLGRAAVTCTTRDHGITAHIAWVEAAAIPLWARALGLATVTVDGAHGSPIVRMRTVITPEWADPRTVIAWRVDGLVYAPARYDGPTLGGAPVEWKRHSRTGRRTGTGLVSVTDLHAGLSTMGIAVLT